MLEEEKTDSESSCLLFEKEKRLSERMHYVCGKNGLGKQLFPLRKKKRLSERMHYVCGKNGLGKQLFLLRKKKSGYPKECIMFAEKTDSESSCLLFEKEKRLSERLHYVCKKYIFLFDKYRFHSNAFQKGFPYQKYGKPFCDYFNRFFMRRFPRPIRPFRKFPISQARRSPSASTLRRSRVYSRCKNTPLPFPAKHNRRESPSAILFPCP